MLILLLLNRFLFFTCLAKKCYLCHAKLDGYTKGIRPLFLGRLVLFRVLQRLAIFHNCMVSVSTFFWPHQGGSIQ